MPPALPDGATARLRELPPPPARHALDRDRLRPRQEPDLPEEYRASPKDPRLIGAVVAEIVGRQQEELELCRR